MNVGGPGMGKSYWTEQIISNKPLTDGFVKIQPKIERVLIFATQPQEWQNNLKRIETETILKMNDGLPSLEFVFRSMKIPILFGFDRGGNHLDFFKALIRYGELFTSQYPLNCLLVLDDSTNYAKFSAPDEIIQIINQRRHIGCDILMNYHSIEDVPRSIYGYANFLNLLKTGSSEKILKDLKKVPKGDEILRAYHYVQNSPKKHPNRIVTLNVPQT